MEQPDHTPEIIENTSTDGVIPAQKMRDVSVPLEQIVTNPMVIIASIALTVLPMIPHLILWGRAGEVTSVDFLRGLVGTLFLIVAHEIVHAAGWIIFGRVPPGKIKFGIMWKTGSPYAHAEVPMRAWGYRIGAILPLFITGLLPVALGTAVNQAWLTVAGAILVSGAVGDLVVLWVIREIPADALVIDHPSNAGCFVLEETA